MNFNLDVPRVFKLLKPNLKGIVTYTLAVILVICSFVGLFVLNILMYKLKSLHISCPIIFTCLLFNLFIFVSIYYSGLNFEIIHNFIEENELFMPTVKGRFKEYVAKGTKAFLGYIVYYIIILIISLAVIHVSVLIRDISLMIYTPMDLIKLLNTILVPFLVILILPFFMAYAYTFKLKSFFDKDNFTILKYSYPEFIYSYAFSQIFMYVVSVLTMSVILLATIVAGITVFGLSFIGKSILTAVIACIIFGIFLLAIIFGIFFVNTIVMLFAFSLQAQSYNYGKYFFCKNEAPRRTALEIIVPFLIIAILCISGICTDKFNDILRDAINKNSQNYSQLFIQNP